LLDDYTAELLLATAIVAFPLIFPQQALHLANHTYREYAHSNGRLLGDGHAGPIGGRGVHLFAENMVVGQTALVRGAVVLIAQLVGIAIVWVGRFLILDRWLFKLPATLPIRSRPLKRTGAPDFRHHSPAAGGEKRVGGE
jgi:hypothetical protein